LYSVVDQLMCNIVTFLMTPLIKISKFHDCITGAFLQLTMFCKTLAFGLLTNSSQWYVLYVFTLVPQWIPGVCMRSLMSKQCSPDEVGRVYSLLAVCECMWPIVENSLYGAVYAATVDVYPSAIHLVESLHGFIIFTSFLGIHLLLRRQHLEDNDEIISNDQKL
ncbi:unnamed protein product, partial [Meganyctiphanes norvegica]